jgi:peptide deformylase
MSVLPLVIIPDTQLRLTSEPVGAITGEVKKLADDMLETMYDAPGIGLAAIQLGRPLRLVTIDLARKEEEPQPVVFVNPEITWSSEERSIYEEGCLSIPEYYAEVERPASVKVGYTDLKGAKQELLAEGLMATCIQHEIDHLNGVLFIDYLSKLKRDMVMKKFQKAKDRR